MALAHKIVSAADSSFLKIAVRVAQVLIIIIKTA